MSAPGDKLRAISQTMRIAALRGILKYSGGRVVGEGIRTRRGLTANTVIPASSTQLNTHFTRNNTSIYQPLTDQYAKVKQLKFGNKPILVASGRTKKSLVGQARVIPRGQEAYRVIFPLATAYAKYLGETKERHPTRLTSADVDRLEKDVAGELKTVLQAINMLDRS